MNRTVTRFAKTASTDDSAASDSFDPLDHMSGSKHTPGPWVIGVDARYPAEPCVDAIVDGVVWHVALCHNGPGPEDASAEANARLIAAAPDLFAALKDALPLLQADVQRLASASSKQPLAENTAAFRKAKARYDTAVAAVAKAESGELPDHAGSNQRSKLRRKPRPKN